MYRRLPLDSYKELYPIEDPHPLTVVLGTDIFLAPSGNKNERRKRDYQYRENILDALANGEICGLFSDFQCREIEKHINREIFLRFINERLYSNEKAKCFEISFPDYLMKREGTPKYYEVFFKLADDNNLQWDDFASIIIAVELRKPIVSDDRHFRDYQKKIQDAEIECHRGEYTSCYKEKIEFKPLGIYSIQYFCNNILHL